MSRKATNFRDVNENPCNMCMPMGGILALKGLENSMVILHGSQGCATYMRRHIAEHFNEPIDVASSSLNEKGTVYGGEKNLKQGLDNMIKAYRPGVIGILTTCLADTIGEDIDRISQDYLVERGYTDLPVVTVNSPGYGGTHAEGYWLTLRRIVEKLARKTEPHTGINIFVPNISPADIREIKRWLELMQVSYTLLPDFSDTLDRPYQRPYRKMPEGGTPLADIAAMGGAAATLQLGVTLEDSMSPGRFLETEFGVPLYNLPLPMGVTNTDLFFNQLTEITGKKLPAELQQERGRLLDCMIDSHKYNGAGRSVIFGEPENIYAVTRTCLENGIYPVVIATGSKNPQLVTLLEDLLTHSPVRCTVLTEADFATIRVLSRGKANLAIGSSDGRYLSEREDIPLVRYGFPIHDRTGGQRLLSVGYRGTTYFLDQLTNTLLENKHKHYRKSIYQAFYLGINKTLDSAESGGEQHVL
ncbi:nitrogenase molybdenum-iron protein NifN [Desulforamulus aeronauticus DSM 10349]|uniref:Nitrogenase molybdenum-iron protein NifN n=1 Tax=Desulforamulus aeronauticus DSM 10349 TaxID=1121421 RepID=A0A1M6S454_9FIRM|nr:nitrogenase molybdenum-iron protein NifN [Desulforamulus aeronauticus DSM 10349]